jgi:hypothetical protein
MRLTVKLLSFLLLLASINFVVLPSANAGCQDFPESVTPQCVAENLALAKLAQEAYEAAQVAKRLQEEQAARDNAAKDAAERAAKDAADTALSPDDCARSSNRYLQRCIDASVEKARLANEAKDAAERAATAAADNALSPDDCARSTNRLLQRCIDASVEKARISSEATIEAERAATAAADNALSPDDCARSTNRLLQRCIDASVEKARIANETLDSIRKATELEALQKIANEKFTVNDCSQATNKLNQVCLDAAVAKDLVKKTTTNVTKKLRETQSALTEPVLNAEGEVVLNALLKSKSLSSKDILDSLSTRNLNSEDKKLLSSYAQKLNEIKSNQSSKSIKIPLSNSLYEVFTSATPLICKVEAGLVKTLKSGVCVLNIKFATESGFEVETTKKLTLKR